MTFVEKIKVAIADDHRIFRGGIKMALSSNSDLEILWEAENGKEVLRRIVGEKPDVLLMDISMPEMDGIETMKLLRKEYKDIKIIMLTTFDDEKTIYKTMEMGANAYLPKTTHPDEIYKAIVTCMNGEFYFNSMVSNAMILKLRHRKNGIHSYGNPVPEFNENEIKILQLLAEDKNSEEIAKINFP